MEKTKISSRQLTIIIAVFTIGTTILVTPAAVASRAKNDAWMVPLISMGIGIIVIWLYMNIVSLYPNKNIFEIIEIVLGKWVGMIATIFIIFVSLISVSQLTWYVGNFMTTHILVDTPIYAIHIIYLVVIIYGARLGLETMARSSELIFPVIVLLFVLVILLVSPQSKYENLQPLFEYGVKPILSSSIFEITILCLPLIILLTIPSTWTNSLKDYKKSFFIGYIIGGFIIFITVLFCLLVLSYKTTSQSQFPTYLLAKKVNVLQFFQRLEPIIAVIWIVSIFYRTFLYMYTTLKGLTHIFGLKNYKYITTALGILALGLSFIAYPDAAYQKKWDSFTWASLIFTMGLLLPLILLTVGLIKKKKQNSS